MPGIASGLRVLPSAADTLAGAGQPGNKQRHARRTRGAHALWEWGRELASSAGGEGSPPVGGGEGLSEKGPLS